MAVTPFAPKRPDNVTELFTNIAMVKVRVILVDYQQYSWMLLICVILPCTFPSEKRPGAVVTHRPARRQSSGPPANRRHPQGRSLRVSTVLFGC
jgi:hypothetical protein